MIFEIIMEIRCKIMIGLYRKLNWFVMEIKVGTSANGVGFPFHFLQVLMSCWRAHIGFLILSSARGREGGGETYFTNDNINCSGLKVRIVWMACLECWTILTLYLLMPLKSLPGWSTSYVSSQILFSNKVPRHLCSVNINCNTKTHWYWRRRLRMRHPPY